MGEIKRIDEHEDKKLVVRLILDDEKAFDLLYRKYHVAIYRNILKLVKSNEHAQDLLQEVFFTLWDKRSQIDANKPVANWLFVVSYNKSITHIKKSANACVVFEEILADVSDETFDPFISEEKLTFIEEAVNRLSPQKRRVFELCKIEHKTYEETAKAMGISRYTVKEYLSQAIASIKSQVKCHFDDRAIILLVILFIPFLKK
ncbi:RNA polymerase sigma factor [Mucilaginibacter sp. HD30]